MNSSGVVTDTSIREQVRAFDPAVRVVPPGVDAAPDALSAAGAFAHRRFRFPRLRIDPDDHRPLRARGQDLESYRRGKTQDQLRIAEGHPVVLDAEQAGIVGALRPILFTGRGGRWRYACADACRFEPDAHGVARALGRVIQILHAAAEFHADLGDGTAGPNVAVRDDAGCGHDRRRERQLQRHGQQSAADAKTVSSSASQVTTPGR